jgi:mannose-6-phosphate isomerase-like protein (cupin superfamily)
MNIVRSFLFRRIFTVQRVTPWIHATKKAALLAIATSLYLSASNVYSYSQSNGVATYSIQQLTDLARQMREESAKTPDTTNDALEQHLDSITILAVRTRSGRAELHATSADAFFVVQGHATLVTGGTIINPRGTEEVRGDSVQGGARAELRVGDVVHIPANTPHQLLLDGTGPFVYVLIKVPAR